MGMPGTGKTYTIAIMLKIFIDLGKKVILSSYTHFALDNILKKFIELFPLSSDKIVRIAHNKFSVDSSIRKLIYNKSYMKATKQLDKFVKNKKIFAVTCLSANHNILYNLNFDYCIIDEAS